MTHVEVHQHGKFHNYSCISQLQQASHTRRWGRSNDIRHSNQPLGFSCGPRRACLRCIAITIPSYKHSRLPRLSRWEQCASLYLADASDDSVGRISDNDIGDQVINVLSGVEARQHRTNWSLHKFAIRKLPTGEVLCQAQQAALDTVRKLDEFTADRRHSQSELHAEFLLTE